MGCEAELFVRSSEDVGPRVSVNDWNVRVLFFRLVLVLTVDTCELSIPNLKDISEKLLEKEFVCLELVFLFKCEPQTPEKQKLNDRKELRHTVLPESDFNTNGGFFSLMGLFVVGFIL